MITEDYVSFEIVKLLKEKGFDEKTNCIFYYYEEAGGWCFEKLLPEDKFNEEKMLHCPTHQMTLKWLRKVHKIHIKTSLQITDGKLSAYIAIIYVFDENGFFKKQIIMERLPSDMTYEEAVEVAIKYCLENLI